MELLRFSDLECHYGAREVFAGAGGVLADRERVGLVGPNGAGKSSLMRIAATVTRPTTGQVLFDGIDVVARPDLLRRNLGYLPQDFGVYPHLTAREFLSYLAAVKGMPARVARIRIGELLELFDLAGAGKRPLGKYSGGMLRRVGIAQALLADPKVLVIDEPTAGLDPEERVVFRNLLSDLAASRVVLLSTHIVSDVESVAADIAIMANGRLRLRGSPQELLRRAEGQVWEMTVPPRGAGPAPRTAPCQPDGTDVGRGARPGAGSSGTGAGRDAGAAGHGGRLPHHHPRGARSRPE